MDINLDDEMPDVLLDLIFRGMQSAPTGRDLQLRADLQTVIRHRRFNERDSIRLSSQQIRQVTDSLPKLSEVDLERIGQLESMCPICMNLHRVSIAEEEHAQAMDSPALPIDDMGVTQLKETCGHIFCRKDILTWVRGGHPSCPLCRTSFIKSSTPNHDTDGQQVSDDEFNEAMSRIMDAYREERQSTHSIPSTVPVGTNPFQIPELEEPEEDRHEYSSMYS